MSDNSLHYLLIAVLLLSLPFIAFGQDRHEYRKQETEEEFRLNIIDDEENITVLSRRPENARQAMGIITTINRREIELFGANSLYEVIDRVVGTYSLGTLLFSKNQISMRGDVNGNFSNRIAILLNGRPTWGSASEGVDYTVLLGMPLEVVERLEIHRGPGSIYHGSAAFIGAINIVTKRSYQTHEASAEAGGGTFGTTFASMAGGAANIGSKENPRRNEQISFYGGVRYFDEDGFDGFLFTPEELGGQRFDYALYDRNLGAFAEVDYKGLRINMLATRSSVVSLQETAPGDLIADEMTGEKLFINAGYFYRFSKDWNLNLNASYVRDRASLGIRPDLFSSGSDDDFEIIDNDDYVIEGSLSGNLRPNLKFTVGTEGRLISGGASSFSILPAYDTSLVRGYADLRYSPLGFIHLFGGLQFQEFDEFDTGKLTPKVGMIIDLLPSVSLKMMYGYATRQPSQIEENLLFSEGDLTINRPERIRTFETQLTARFEDLSFSAAYYYSRYLDQIVPRSGPFTFLGWTNADQDMTTLGFELEAQYAALKNLYFTSSYAYAENRQLTENPNVVEIGVTHAPTFFFKAGVAWFVPRQYSVGLFSSYYSEPTEIVLERFTDPNNPPAGSFTWATLNAEYHLNENIKLHLYITNLTNAEVRWPDIANEQIRSLPGRGGRAAYLSLVIRLGDFY